MSTSQATAAAAPSQPRAFAAIFWGGLLAGVFDISQAFIGFGLLERGPFASCSTLPAGFSAPTR